MNNLIRGHGAATGEANVEVSDSTPTHPGYAKKPRQHVSTEPRLKFSAHAPMFREET